MEISSVSPQRRRRGGRLGGWDVILKYFKHRGKLSVMAAGRPYRVKQKKGS